ncbi:hypothetical protein NQS96_05860 [Pseudoalteromonas shioyasakiensis]|uniref:hypothetical protein n=1 Tax=Pseudoalteromonas shioyasakiensis TaxID=1190813 RepID=UPI0021172DB9|nr:hypothetical protein [Pseudoalteromonas shioyasakiensis]MCQ8881329.1 hypothetical protein [Pseudoalteromonas shioyasakiensis]
MKFRTVFLASSLFLAGIHSSFLQASSPLIQSQQGSEACNFNIKFSSEPKEKQQTLNISDGVDLNIKQFVSVKQIKAANIASNVTCQQLVGQKYTGSQQEWQGFVKNALQGLINAGFKNLQFTRVGQDDAVYEGKLENMEYSFTGAIDKNKQIIHNLAVLDKSNNQVVIISVSGNERVADEIKEEYTNLVKSFSL